MPTIADLRSEAKRMGISVSTIRGAATAAELQEIISDYRGESRPRKKSAGRTVRKASAARKVRKATARGTQRKTAAGRTVSTRKAAGRKKAAPAARTTARRKAAPAKSQRGAQAKRQSTARRTNHGDSGRNRLDRIDYSYTEGWNPREGSPPDRIIKALKRFRGDRDKVFAFLVPHVWDFVSRNYRDGSKRTKAEAENHLAWRIARTDWEFAIRTGQHEASKNRVEYGTGGTGNGNYKPTRRKAAPAKRKAAPARKKAAPAARNSRKAASTRKKAAPAKRTVATRRPKAAPTRRKAVATRKTNPPAAKRGGKTRAAQSSRKTTSRRRVRATARR